MFIHIFVYKCQLYVRKCHIVPATCYTYTKHYQKEALDLYHPVTIVYVYKYSYIDQLYVLVVFV